jgi:hypothetical protein
MTWVKIDDGMHQNTKVRGVSLAARWTYIASICRSGATQSDGEILKGDLGLVDGNPKLAKELVAAGLWETTSRGSYVIHDYLVYNRSRLQIAETAKINAENGKRGLATRYAKRLANGEPAGLANGLANARSENSVLKPSSSLGEPDTQNEPSEPPSDSLGNPKHETPVPSPKPTVLTEEWLQDERELFHGRLPASGFWSFDRVLADRMNGRYYKQATDKRGYIHGQFENAAEKWAGERNGNGIGSNNARGGSFPQLTRPADAKGPGRTPDLVG